MGPVCSREKAANFRSGDRMEAPVTLHIYNVGTARPTQMFNRLLRQLGTGAFHCGVEVYGCEWSYSDIACAPGESPVGTGVFCCKPMNCEGHSYKESVPMGKTTMSEGDILCLLNLLKKEWPVYAYNTLRKNCCHFSDEFCQRLGVGSIPNWVMNLAGAGAAVVAAGDTVCCRMMAGQGAILCCGSGPGRGANAEAREDIQVDVVESLPVLPPFQTGSSRTSSRQVVTDYTYREDLDTPYHKH